MQFVFMSGSTRLALSGRPEVLTLFLTIYPFIELDLRLTPKKQVLFCLFLT